MATLAQFWPSTQKILTTTTTASTMATTPVPTSATCPTPPTSTAIETATATGPPSSPPTSTLPSRSCQPTAPSQKSYHRVQPTNSLPFFLLSQDAPMWRNTLFLSNISASESALLRLSTSSQHPRHRSHLASLVLRQQHGHCHLQEQRRPRHGRRHHSHPADLAFRQRQQR